MKVNVVGGGPGGLFTALLLKKDDPGRSVEVFERNRPDDTFGFGVVFSDATLEEVAEADPPTLRAIEERFYHWDDIHIHYQGRRLESTGHGFAGLSRRELLLLLHRRCREVGVGLHFEADVADLAPCLDADLVIGADGINSTVRRHFADAFEPAVDLRPNRFVWLGTTRPFPAFTFYFRESEHGLWRVHAYQYDASGRSTFIVEATERTWRRAGMDTATEEETVRFLSHLFAEELDGHPLIRNRSVWRRFPTIVNARWAAGNVVLIGDAAHTAHFSVGSGTRLAMLDGIALAEAVRHHDASGSLADALAAYEAERRRPVESLQRAAQASLQWFEDTERYFRLEPEQFAFSLLTRSLRISHENLRERDPAFVEGVDRWVARKAEIQAGVTIDEHERALGIVRSAGDRAPPPPLFTPLRLRDLTLANRVGVSAMCQYSARDGTVDDWHLVNLGSRAIGGAGLVMAEMTAIGRDGRISPGCAGIYTGGHITAWRRLADFVKRFTSAKIGIQLGHAGRKGSTRLDWEGPNEPLDDGGWPIVSASPIGFFEHSPVPAELDEAGMDTLIADFERSTEMAVEAGFDIVEIHMAHGYLLASFLSPLTNQRTDRYGGSAGKPAALPPPCRPRGARVVARRASALRAPLGGRLVARRQRTRRRGHHFARAESPRLRRRRCFDRPDGALPATPLRAAVSDPLRGSHPPRGRDRHDGRRQHLVLRGRERDHRGGPGRPLPHGARAPVGSILDPSRRLRARVSAALAVAVRDSGQLHAAVRRGFWGLRPGDRRWVNNENRWITSASPCCRSCCLCKSRSPTLRNTTR